MDARETGDEDVQSDRIAAEVTGDTVVKSPDEGDKGLEAPAACPSTEETVNEGLSNALPPPPSPPVRPDRDALEAALANVANTVEELDRAFAWETKREEDEEIALERDRVLLQDAQQLHEKLSARAARASASASSGEAAERTVLRTQGHVAHLSRRNEALRQALLSFIDEDLLASTTGQPGPSLSRDKGTGSERPEAPRDQDVQNPDDDEVNDPRTAHDDVPGPSRARKRRRTQTPPPAAAMSASAAGSDSDLGTWLRADPALRLHPPPSVTSGPTPVHDDDVDDDDEQAESPGRPKTRGFLLRRLLETLMNRAVTHPENPWTTLTVVNDHHGSGGNDDEDDDNDSGEQEKEEEKDRLGTPTKGSSYPRELVAFLVRAGIAVAVAVAASPPTTTDADPVTNSTDTPSNLRPASDAQEGKTVTTTPGGERVRVRLVDFAGLFSL